MPSLLQMWILLGAILQLSMAYDKHDNILETGDNVILSSRTDNSSLTGNLKSIPEIDCNLTVSKASINKFGHMVYYFQLNFIYLNLTHPAFINIGRTPPVVQENIWTWTFYGKHGALEFLKWPTEFRIWSLGFLASTVYGPLPITLVYKSGDCTNVTVGERRYDLAISNALIALTDNLMAIKHDDEYGPSFFCYKKRRIIKSEWLYNLCKHVVCPVDGIRYSCCTNRFDTKKQRRIIKCDNTLFDFDEMWTLLPVIVAVLLFAYSPLFFIHFASKYSLHVHENYNNICSGSMSTFPDETDEDEPILNDGTSHVTLLNTIFHPLIKAIKKSRSSFFRLLRFLLPCFSLSLIAIQIILDHVYLQSFVVDCIKMGVPLGFRSLIAGYTTSKNNFLMYLGGPYVAIGLYLSFTCCALALPKSLSHFFTDGGLSKRNDQCPKYACFLGLYHIELYGNVQIQGRDGFLKLFNTYLAQIYMLLNVKYWKFVFKIQIARWNNLCKGYVYYILFPLHCVICFFEIIFCILLQGIPFFAVSLTIFRSYCGILITQVSLRRPIRIVSAIVGICVFPVMFVCIFISLFMFCLIFLDGCLFLTRIFLFTYTGLVAYPKQTYGYLIFFLTVVFYLWTCVNEFANHYDQILETTITVCCKIQDTEDSHQLVYISNDCKGVRKSMFLYVIERYSPRRKKVFLSLLKLCLILGIIGVSIDLLMKMDRIKDMHVFIHVITALFTCSLPQIVKSVFLRNSEHFKRKQFQRAIHSVVCDYIREHTDDSME